MNIRHHSIAFLALLSVLLFAGSALAGSKTYYESGKIKEVEKSLYLNPVQEE